MEELAISSINVEDMADYMATIVNDAIEDVEEIKKTNPIVHFKLGRDNHQKLVLIASVEFPDESTISPMEYTERLNATELIKTLVSNKMKS